MKGRRILALIIGFSIFGVGCGQKQNDSSDSTDSFVRGEEIEVNPVVANRYTNQQDIEGQWCPKWWTNGNDYGIGDPFVMRWNGKYYMYPSTNDDYSGVKVFVSDDMVNWTYAGYAVSDTDQTSHGAYAPEVVYYDGYFYMCQSRAGRGHYIYRSESPTEGFKLVSKNPSYGDASDLNYGNMGMGIDGAFYVSDSGELYILHTSTPAGLKYNKISDVNNITNSTISQDKTLGYANLNHWIEGPGIIRRGEYSYLTYCGNHVYSIGYRIGYSYAQNLTDLGEFIQPEDNITIINTDSEHYGLGHSSNVNGPDLDSIYTAYHSFVGDGPCRRYNVDRYFASGSLLTANGPTCRAVAMPNRPYKEASSAEELVNQEGKYVLGEHEGYFTAEYNLTPCDGQALFFGQDYSITFGENRINLLKNGKEVANKQVNYTQGKLVTVRVENGNGIGYVYLNGMRVIEYNATSSAGKIAYAKNQGVAYTAYTNDVFGSSDFEAIKNFPTRFPATSYLKGENRGFSIRKASEAEGGLRLGEKQDITISEDGENAVNLGSGDWVKYAVDIGSTDQFSLSAKILSAKGAVIKVTIGKNSITKTLSDCDYPITVNLGNITAVAAVTTMKVEVVSGEAQLVWFEAQKDAAIGDVNLDDYTVLRGNVAKTDEGLVIMGTDATGGDGVVTWGGKGMGDYEVEFVLSATEDSKNFGIMLRSNYYSYHNDQPINSWRGYYLQISQTLATLLRMDYGSKMVGASKNQDFINGQDHTIKMRAEGNSFKVWVDNQLKIDTSDDCAFTYGKVGIFVGVGTVTVKDIKISKI